ncbi:MAG: hypothetical protein H6997_03475 [Moraxellaceae bacterium]|nr:hypothetical protein [Pseudomonadales bacterium]MCP5176599.1 hypothetical protein [Moraxellaceae bacterium]
MRNVVATLSLLINGFAQAQTPLTQSLSFDVLVEAGIRFRQDQIDWNIGNLPTDILSELDYKDIKISQPVFAVSVLGPYNIVVKGQYADGDINTGLVYDYDYNGSRSDIYLLSKNSLKGNVTDLNLQISKGFFLNNLSLSVDLGWSEYKQKLNSFDGFQLIPNYGAFNGLDNHYDVMWQGKFLGTTLGFDITKKWYVDLGLRYHFFEYKAVADWNLRKEFAHPLSFEHLINAEAWEGSLAVLYKFNKYYALKLFYNNLLAKGENGTDLTYFNNNSVGTYFLNEVNWQSKQYGVGLSYKF